MRTAPDGHRLVVTTRTLSECGLWVYDLHRKRVLTPLHRGDEADWPLWSSDGQHVVFAWINGGRSLLASQGADGSRPPVILSKDYFVPSTWAAVDRLLGVVDGGRQLAVASFEKPPGVVESLGKTADVERWPELSPDGRWLAYASNASGRDYDVYICPYPGPGASTRVSVDGGSSPARNPSGDELFYVSPSDAADERHMMAVSFEAGAPPRVGAPKMLFDFNARTLVFDCTPVRCYDAAPGGERFYVTQSPGAPASAPVVTHINLWQNWFEELKAKVPFGK